MRRRTRTQLPEASINLTSLLDITFVLLIAFMVVAPAVKYNVPLDLPKSEESNNLDTKQPLRLQITWQGSTAGYFLNGRTINFGQIPEAVKNDPAYSSELGVSVEADRTVPWEVMARLITLLNHHEILQIGVVTEQGA